MPVLQVNVLQRSKGQFKDVVFIRQVKPSFQIVNGSCQVLPGKSLQLVFEGSRSGSSANSTNRTVLKEPIGSSSFHNWVHSDVEQQIEWQAGVGGRMGR